MSIDAGARRERFTHLYREHVDRVLAYATRHVGAAAAEDVVAETFVVAWRRLDAVPDPALPWLLVVARNTISTTRRAQRRHDDAADRLAVLDRLAAHPDPQGGVVDRDTLLRALATMSAAHREALLLTAWDGLSAARAARVAGCSAATFHVRLHRARRRLAEAEAQADARDDRTPDRRIREGRP